MRKKATPKRFIFLLTILTFSAVTTVKFTSPLANSQEKAKWEVPFYFHEKNKNFRHAMDVRSLDANGDGLMDIVNLLPTCCGGYSSLFINKGNGTWEEKRISVDANTKPYFVDVDGDGLVDVISMYYTGSGHSLTGGVSINDGQDWKGDSTWGASLISKLSLLESQVARPHIADINGDGLPDLLFSSHSYFNNSTVHLKEIEGVFLNNGRGWGVDFYCKKEIWKKNGKVTKENYEGDCDN